MASPGLITIVICCAFVCAGEPLSAACTLNEKLPEAVGVPETAPVEVFTFNPEGAVPTNE